MTYKEIQQDKILLLETALRTVFDSEFSEKGDLRDVTSIARRLVERDVSVERSATWIKDESYQGKSKVLYRCSYCNHWKAVKKEKQDEIQHLHYCNFCGARMFL